MPSHGSRIPADVFLAYIFRFIDFRETAVSIAVTCKMFNQGIKKTAESHCANNRFMQVLGEALVPQAQRPSLNLFTLLLCLTRQNFKKMSEILSSQRFNLWVVSYERNANTTIERLSRSPRDHFFTEAHAKSSTANASSVRHWLSHEFQGVSPQELQRLEKLEKGPAKSPLPYDHDFQSITARL